MKKKGGHVSSFDDIITAYNSDGEWINLSTTDTRHTNGNFGGLRYLVGGGPSGGDRLSCAPTMI